MNPKALRLMVSLLLTARLCANAARGSKEADAYLADAAERIADARRLLASLRAPAIIRRALEVEIAQLWGRYVRGVLALGRGA